jgi:dienelactone hydrolase
VLLHGSGGVNGGNELWAKHFNEMGIAAFLLDSFSARGIVSTSADQALLGRLNMILDAYRSHEMLAAHPRIDPARIAVMGFSRGGQSALYSSMRRFQEMWSPRAQFALHIPLYASCSAAFARDTDVTGPIRQHHGLADDYVTIAPCRPYFERLRAAGRDVQLIEYPDAHHAYDNPFGAKTPTIAKGSQSTRACTLKEEANGILVNVSNGQPFTYKDPCVEIDPHLSYNEAAAKATQKAVKEQLRAAFKLE